MDILLILSYLIVFFVLLLGIEQQREIGPFSLDKEDLGDDLCKFCPLEDWEKGCHGIPSGYISCEGRSCEEAYEYYLEDFDENK